MEANKKCLMICNKNCITYKEVFPLFKSNLLWSGRTEWSGGLWFETTNNDDVDKIIDNKKMKNVAAFWLTNIEHGRRHKPLSLLTKDDNLRFNKKLQKPKYQNIYKKYDNYDAIEIPLTEAIPSDYEGIMGVPISFLDKYCPEQFEILGITSGREEFDPSSYPSKKYENAIQHNKNGSTTSGSKANTRATILVDKPQDIYYTADNCNGKLEIVYARILIRKIK